MHDLVEIYAGDTFAYDEEGKKTQRERELFFAEFAHMLIDTGDACQAVGLDADARVAEVADDGGARDFAAQCA